MNFADSSFYLLSARSGGGTTARAPPRARGGQDRIRYDPTGDDLRPVRQG